MFKINSFEKSLKYDGKILLRGAKKYSGTFFTKTESGSQLCLSYKNGLLRSASKTKDNILSQHIYEYDSGENLINVKKNGKDVFVKDIKHNIGLDYTRQETINGVIGRTFNKAGKLIRYVISPKLLFGFIKYTDDMSIETRYFLNQAEYLGRGRIQLKHIQGDFILNNGVVDKTIIRNSKNGAISVINSDGDNYTGTFKSANGNFCASMNYIVDKKGHPVLVQACDSENKWQYNKKVFYDDFGHKLRETSSECGGKWFVENTFDGHGNVILSKRLNQSGKVIQTTKSKYNDNNLLVKESVYNQNNKLIEKTINKYYPDKSIKSCEITYYDSFGSYKNLSEYDKNKHLIKFSEIYDDFKTETFYDENDCIIKFVEKDEKDNIKLLKQYINKDGECVKTVVKDVFGAERYYIEHLRKNKSDVLKNINVFLSPLNKLIGKEFIIHDNESGITKYIYTNKNGKRIKYETLCNLLGDEV